MAIYLGESDDRYQQFEDKNIHIILAHVKSALHHCEQAMTCKICCLMSDSMMLAAVLINKIVLSISYHIH